jgi:hypothetical protein
MGLSETLAKTIPFTLKLNPFYGPNLGYLAYSYILTRLGVGATRIVADLPSLNLLPTTKREKTRNLLERIFIECVGTTGGFLSIHAVQDVTSKVLEQFKPKLAPQNLLNALQHSLPKADLAHVEQALKQVFPVQGNLASAKNSIFEVTFGKASLVGLAETLKRPDLLKVVEGRTLGKIAHEASRFFAPLNRSAGVTTLVAIGVSAFLSGTPIQWFNDRVLRKRLGPWLLDRLMPDTIIAQNPSGASSAMVSSHAASPVSPAVLPKWSEGEAPSPPPPKVMSPKVFTEQTPQPVQPTNSVQPFPLRQPLALSQVAFKPSPAFSQAAPFGRPPLWQG